MPMQPIVITLDPWLACLYQWLHPQQVAYFGTTSPIVFQTALKGLSLQCVTQVVAERTGTTLWHKASNPRESGLIPPGQLQCYWQGLKTLETQSVHAISIDEALAGNALPPQWLWVDRLPALSLLRGAPTALSHAKVVLARVVIQEANAPSGTDLNAVRAYMQLHGFVLAGVEPERHPAVGTALFFKDYANLALIETLAKTEALTQRNVVAQERDHLFESRYRVASEQQQLILQHERRVTEMQAALDAQVQATKQVQEELSSQAGAHLQRELAAKKKIENLEAGSIQFQSEIAALNQQYELQINGLNAQITEFNGRQQLLQQELYKAEVQIDLIKDLLLRNPTV